VAAAPLFARRFLIAERNVNIMKSEPAIFPEKEPGAEAERVSKRKRSSQWQQTN